MSEVKLPIAIKWRFISQLRLQKGEIAKLYDNAAGAKVGDTDLQAIFKLDKDALLTKNIDYTKLPSKK